MGLPVHQIIATLEEQMLGNNDDEDGGDWDRICLIFPNVRFLMCPQIACLRRGIVARAHE